MRVSTNVGALVAGAILAAVLSIVAVGDGRPTEMAAPPVEAASAPDAAVYPGAPPIAQPNVEPRADSDRLFGPGSKPDAYVLQGLRGGLSYIVLFLLIHLGLRRIQVSHRWAYAGAGAASALASVAAQTPLWGWRVLVEHGGISSYLGTVAAFGAIMGFLYQWRAGLDAEGDDPALLERTLKALRGEPGRSGEAVSGAISDDGALVDTGTSEYFDGPVQVRTSVPVMFVAALVSAGFFGIAKVLFGAAGAVTETMQSDAAAPLGQAVGSALESQMVTILLMGAVAPLPFTAVILMGHMILRAMNKQSYGAYLIAGAAAPLLLILIMGPLGLILGLQAAVPLAISMCTYRNMAGLEPKAVKEDVMVSDRRNLVGANHVRRQFGRVVKS